MDKDFNLVVGLRIREVRETLNMTREQFSEMCGISESFLAAVEGGKKSITSKTLYKICDATNVSADYFIRGKNSGFAADTMIELISSLEEPFRGSAIRLLREYVQSILLLERRAKKKAYENSDRISENNVTVQR